jgi:hypothetical protein
MPNPAFTWGFTDFGDRISSGIEVILLYDKCLAITDIEDGTELAAAIAAYDVYKICPTFAENPEGETQFITITTSKGTEEKPTRRDRTLTFESYETLDSFANAKLIDGSSKWRIATINSSDSAKRIMTFYDKQIDNVIISTDHSGNAQDNVYMLKGSASFSMPINAGATNVSNGESYDITANTDMLAAIACVDADCA